MNAENILPFFLIVAPFAVAFLLEAIVIYFFTIRRFWPGVGVAFLINLLSLAVLYGSSLLMGKLGYEFNGLRLPLQVILMLWWLSVIADGLLLQLFNAKTDKRTVFTASLVMNSISYLFLYFFITNSH
jgi:hypothetical protein